MTKKPTSPTLASDQGQTSRLCAALKIVPMPGDNKQRAEFEAVAKWLKDEQKRKQMKELF